MCVWRSSYRKWLAECYNLFFLLSIPYPFLFLSLTQELPATPTPTPACSGDFQLAWGVFRLPDVAVSERTIHRNNNWQSKGLSVCFSASSFIAAQIWCVLCWHVLLMPCAMSGGGPQNWISNSSKVKTQQEKGRSDGKRECKGGWWDGNRISQVSMPLQGT